MRSLIGAIRNAAPVAYSSARTVTSLVAPSRSNTTKQLKAMGAVSTLFTIVNKTSTATASANWHLYRKADGRGRIAGPENRKEVFQHAALDLWNKPNPFMTRQEFVEAFMQHVDLTGESEWVVGRANGFDIPLELWPIRPDRMKPVPHPTEFLSGWIYLGPDGEKVPLSLDQVIQIRMPNPDDPYRGLGPVQSLLADLDSAVYSAQWNANFFKNSAEPGGIIEVEKRLSDPEFDEMRNRWNEQHRGVGNAHRVAILEHGKWVSTSFSMRDMQFVQLREVSRNTIMEGFGISKPMLGISEDVNRAAADAGLVQFARHLTVPRLDRIKGALNNDLLPMFGSTGEGLEFDYDNPVPEDQAAENAELTSRASAAATLIGAGFDPNEVLAVCELPDMTFTKQAPAPVAVGRDDAEQAQDS